MAIDLRRIVKLIVDEKNETTLSQIVVEYLTLKQKIEDVDNHTWYMKKGLESSKKRLLSLNEKYEKIRQLFNESTLDDFVEKVNQNLASISDFEKGPMNSIKYIAYSIKLNENEFLNELIRLKSKTDSLMPIEDYLENPDEFLMILG